MAELEPRNYSSEIDSLVVDHVNTVAFDADLDHIAKQSDAELAAEIELEAKKEKEIKKLNHSLLLDIASLGLAEDESYYWNQKRFYGEFEEPATWLAYRKYVSFIKPAAKEKTIYGLEFQENWYRAKKERRAIPIVVLGQKPLVKSGSIVGYDTIALVDRSSGIRIIDSSGKSWLVDWVDNRKRPGVDKHRVSLENRFDHHLIHCITADRIDASIDLPSHEEIKKSYNPVTKKFIYDRNFAADFADIHDTTDLYPRGEVNDDALINGDYLERAMGFASCAPQDVGERVDQIIISYSKKRKNLIETGSIWGEL